MLIYAIGIDGVSRPSMQTPPRPPVRMPIPIPFPGAPRRPGGRPQIQWPPRPGQGGSPSDRVNAVALRDITDDSGGRTEIIHDSRDLASGDREHRQRVEPAVLSRLPGPRQKDGRWHAIRVEVNNRAYRVRARRGYVAS